jgi:hypothetical protein
VLFRDSFWLPIAAVLTFTFLVGVVAGRYTSPSPFATTKTPECATHGDVGALREQLTQMASNRCMTVSTPVLNIQVYETPNVGVKPKVATK